jgi:hypothetical protein
MLDLGIQLRQRLGRITGFQGVGAQRAAHLSHDHRRRQARAGHVALHKGIPDIVA